MTAVSSGERNSDLLQLAGHAIDGNFQRVEILWRAPHEDSAHVDLVAAKRLDGLPELCHPSKIHVSTAYSRALS